MAREILFKAKSIDGEWVEGSYLFCPIRDNEKSELENITYKHWIVSKDGMCYEIDINTLCQYTGLTDKNGRKIFENDVVKKHFYTDYDAFANSEEYVGVVKFIDCAWVVETVREKNKCIRPIFEAMAYSQDVKYFEVIGNIFDNPELLGGGE